MDIDRAGAEALASRLSETWPGLAKVADVPDASSDVVVNATPLGLDGDDPLPFELSNLRPECLVADIIMKPAETRLLREAAALGFATHPGLPMLSEQIPLYREFFRVP